MGGALEYDSNNSGGSWWLSDDDWRALEAAGWTIDWYANKPSSFMRADEDGRWLGALASHGRKQFPSQKQGIAEWTTITGKDPDDYGCACCGPPHSFSWRGEDGSYEYRSVQIAETAGVWS